MAFHATVTGHKKQYMHKDGNGANQKPIMFYCWLYLCSECTGKKPRIAQLMKLKTTKGDRVNIMESVTPSWKKLGFLMDLDSSGQKVKNIEAEHKQNGQDICCQELFTVWLDGADATWGNLIELLVDLEQNELAKQVRDALGL